jgi:hypothetical protein
MSIEQTIAENTQALKEFTLAVTHLTEFLSSKAQPEVAQNTGSRRRGKSSKDASEAGVAHAPEPVAESAVQDTAPTETVAAVESVAENVAAPAEVQKDPLAEPEDIIDLTPSTYKQASDAVVALANSKGRAVALEVLAKFGVAKLPEAKPDQYAAIIAACEAA